MSVLVKYWQEERIPILNGIIFPDGAVWPVHPVDAPRDSPLRLRIREDEQATLGDDTEWTSCSPLMEAANIDLGLKAVVGECGMGGDGYVALLENLGNRIRWIAFFDFSNPFEHVSLEVNQVVAKNNLGESWIIPIEAKGVIEVRS
ncbi:hypothetical protein [Pseudomonas sp. CGJS7]|uniref:hypothetical protein n=1 Tax=Pseudomonas sp. CGJS7 TaxID=3109348 RepID=UPI0030085FBE